MENFINSLAIKYMEYYTSLIYFNKIFKCSINIGNYCHYSSVLVSKVLKKFIITFKLDKDSRILERFFLLMIYYQKFYPRFSKDYIISDLPGTNLRISLLIAINKNEGIINKDLNQYCLKECVEHILKNYDLFDINELFIYIEILYFTMKNHKDYLIYHKESIIEVIDYIFLILTEKVKFNTRNLFFYINEILIEFNCKIKPLFFYFIFKKKNSINFI